ncbi:MAG: hypothetical protein RLZZ450_2799 [Pseudomonadota bacterium]|jgi:tetratricopeptide (TPR) repeat protein
MAGDHDRYVVSGASSDPQGRALDEAGAWEGALSDETDSLETLRHAWLVNGRESDAEAIVAATRPLGPALQEKIVQRLLREGERARSKQSSTASSFRSLFPALRRVPLWSVAAAGILGCWLTAHTPHGGGSWSAAGTTGRDSANEAAPTVSHSTAPSASRETRATAQTSQQASLARRGEALTDLAETYAQQQRFDEAEALFQRALTEQERRLGPAHKEVADTLTRLASLYQRQHLYAKAEPLYVRALEIDPPFAVF